MQHKGRSRQRAIRVGSTAEQTTGMHIARHVHARTARDMIQHALCLHINDHIADDITLIN